MDKPNILYVHTHDTGRYIQPYGYGVPTPNLQLFAEDGVLFRNCFDAGPTCSPSRAGLLAGMCAHSSGMLGLAHRGFSLYDYSKHLARYLGAHEYETALCGVQHEACHDRLDELGYQIHLEGTADYQWKPGLSEEQQGEHLMSRDSANADAAAEYIRQPKDRPFFLSYGMMSTHRPFPAPAADVNPDHIRVPSPVFDNAQTRRDMGGFITMAKTVDRCFGAVMKAVEGAGRNVPDGAD